MKLLYPLSFTLYIYVLVQDQDRWHQILTFYPFIQLNSILAACQISRLKLNFILLSRKIIAGQVDRSYYESLEVQFSYEVSYEIS